MEQSISNYQKRYPESIRGTLLHKIGSLCRTPVRKFFSKERKHIPLLAGQAITANKRQLHSFLNNHDEPVIFTVEAIPAGGFIRAFQLACGVAKPEGPVMMGFRKIYWKSYIL